MSRVQDDIQRFYNFAMEKIQTSQDTYSIEDLFELWHDDTAPEPYSEDDVQAILASYRDVKNGVVGIDAFEHLDQIKSKYGLND
jgi:hypothetical protein